MNEAGEGRVIAAAAVGIATTMFSSATQWQEPGAIATSTLLIIAAVGGAVAGRIAVPGGERIRAHVIAMSTGALAGVGAFGLLCWWLDGRSSLSSVEFGIVSLIGSMPAILLGQWLYERVRRRDERVPAMTVVERPRG